MKLTLCFLFVLVFSINALSTTVKPVESTEKSTKTTIIEETTSHPSLCVTNCKCTERYIPGTVKVYDCKSPLVLTNNSFAALNTKIIEAISFNDVIIDEIREDAFSDFAMLADLVFKGCRIGSIESKAFDTPRRAKFTDCKFEDDPNLFAEKMDELTIANCGLEEIPNLNNMFVLEHLNLSGNYIKNVEPAVLAQLFDLLELILSGNQIEKLPSKLFSDDAALNLLVLDDNPLKHFYIDSGNSLETLSLKNCMLTTFDNRSTYKLNSVSELYLSNNMISEIKGDDFSNMVELSVFDISNNSLTQLEAGIFRGNFELKKVVLNDNNIKNLPSFTIDKGYFMTHTFSCRNCGLETIKPDTFINMPAIVNLDLSHNKFTAIGGMFELTTALNILDISYNDIKYILPEDLKENTNLISINLSGNPLLTINPAAFAHSKALKKIDARDCRLYKLWANNSTTLGSIQTLLVSDNQLTTLTPDDFKVVPSLQAIDLHKNPLRFDEGMCKIFKHLQDISVFPVDVSEALVNLEESLSDDTHGLDNANTWDEMYKAKCNDQVMNELDKIEIDESDYGAYNDIDEPDDDLDSDGKEYQFNEDATSKYDYFDEYPQKTEYVTDRRLEYSPYLLSVTSVFVFTALVVLIVSVTLTLFILNRRNAFNMQKANIPRFKIPAWEHKLGTKKHSGSVYRPLSEDLSGPKTPKMSRYEFAATPGVHSSA